MTYDNARADRAGRPAELDGTDPGHRVDVVEVTVLVDANGATWALPAVRELGARVAPTGRGGAPGSAGPTEPGDPGELAGIAASADLVEVVALPDDVRVEVRDLATARAASLGPGRHVLHLTLSPDTPPRLREPSDPAVLTPLEGLALAEVVLGVEVSGAHNAGHAVGQTRNRAPRTGGLPVVEPGMPVGHAVEARLNAPSADAGAHLLYVRAPSGPGVSVLPGAQVGQSVGAGVVLRVLAHAHDRPTALRRLHAALADCAVVVAGAPSNRCALLAQLDSTLSGLADTDTPRADVEHVDAGIERAASNHNADPVAVLVAAVRASDVQRATQRSAFHARAARGRPEPADATGVPVAMSYAGRPYPVRVFHTGPHTYRIDTGTHVAELEVDRHGPYEWTVRCAGRRHTAVVALGETSCHIELDGSEHRIDLDEGVAILAGWPSLIVAVPATVGEHVEVGDPLVIVEAMKMESTIRATLAGAITAVHVLPNEQVDAGTPMVRIRPNRPTPLNAPAAEAAERPVSFAGMALADTSGRPPFDRVYEALARYLLGYELDPAALAGLLAEHRSFGARASAADPDLLAAEDRFLDLYSGLGMLWHGGIDPTSNTTALGSREHLLAYLQWLDADRAGTPEPIRRRLARALARYGVTDLMRSPDLEAAVVLMFGSQARLPQLAGVVSGILERRLRYRDRVLPLVDRAAAERYDRLTAATEGHLGEIANLSRDARFWLIDEPILEAEQARAAALMAEHLDALAEDPARADRGERITALVECPQPMRELILRRRMASADPDLHAILLEIRARRWYRIRALHDVRDVEVDGIRLCGADYEFEGRRIHVVLAFAPMERTAQLGSAIAAHLAEVPADRDPIVDLMVWRPDARAQGDDLAEDLRAALSGWDLGRPVWRIDVTVSGHGAEQDADHPTEYVTFRTSPDGALAEDHFYHNLHPMLAKRLELWRLENFELTRLPSREDVYLFHGVARANPKDHRLFALAEVRDLTAVPRGRGATTTYPRLERMGLQAIIAMRRARATYSKRERPQANRITLFVRPPWDVPREHWADLAELMVPLAGGAGLEMVVLRTEIPHDDGTLVPTVLNVDGITTGSITVTEESSRDDVVRPLTPYRQKVLTAQRFGVPYPWEILRMFAPPPGTLGTFGPSEFVEHDLDDSGERLIPVDREPGGNSSNLVVGLLTSCTDAYPEGMTRVAMLSDPTRGLGNLAEPECRIVNAALALALEMGVPVEWFAVSSGALISMDSGTENMDWIALTLRRIIEFTQADGEINIVVTGINVGGQPYWNAEATMLLHTRGILVMLPNSAMVLTGKQALDFSGGVSADDNFGIGGFDRVMGPNGQAQYLAASLPDACALLLAHYEHTYVVPGERFPRRTPTADPIDRDVRGFPHAAIPDSDFTTVGDIFSAERNPERKRPFDVRSVMRAVADADSEPLERWARWRGGENSVVWDARIGGIPVCLLGLESRPLPRRGYVPADGPESWTSGTLFPQASRKTARAVNAASGNRPLVVLANLSGFDGSPESMRHWQLEYGAEIGRAVTNFRGPIVFVVISRYHGGAFVVFSKALNPEMEVAAVEGSHASVIGGAPAAATVFAREVRARVTRDPRVLAARTLLAGTSGGQATERRARLAEITEQVRSEKLGEIAAEFDAVHTIDRALATGSVDRIIPAEQVRPYVVDALERGMARTLARE